MALFSQRIFSIEPDNMLAFMKDRLESIRIVCGKNRMDSPLAADTVEIMGVSKTQSADTIASAIELGVMLFGENRVQEANEKWPELRSRYPNTKLHLIGPLQTNKVKDALALFDAIETLDREKLVDAIAKEVVSSKLLVVSNRSKTNNQQLATNNFYIQVNTGEESQKAGCAPKDVGKLLEYARAAKLNVVGLMCIPPVNEYPAPHFALMHELKKEFGLHKLSMGMSHDYALAVRFGATHVRVGSALFGERVKSNDTM
jgi:pyridoxal phosphate enzyme (YggS family)